MEARFAAEHFDGGFEQDDGGGAVDVVVAIEQDGFVGGDGALETVDGGGHAEHEKGIVELGYFGVEESEGFSCIGDASGDEEFSEDEGRRASLARASAAALWLGEGPALARKLARR